MLAAALWLFIRRHDFRRFLIKKTGDCSGPPMPKITKSDAERLATTKEYEDRRRRGFKAALALVENECRWQTPRHTAHWPR